MFTVETTNAFKRDIKKVKAQGKNYDLFDEVLDFLLNGRKLPIKYRNHKLTGNYKGYSELHIQPDWLLIYKIEKNILYLVRTGSHSELFI